MLQGVILMSANKEEKLVNYPCMCSAAQSSLTLCNPMDCSLPGFSVHEIFQARIQEWVVIFSDRDLPDPGFEPASPTLQVDSLPRRYQGSPNSAIYMHSIS